ncbi:MAG: hypothetical protein K1X94_10875 [Sandaracinaceae bacterium]|nr:hypothetical protein [Sandaracinaceae bacterium]
MRTLAPSPGLWAPLLLIALPACSLAFSGSRYMNGEGDDAGSGVDAPGLDAPGLDAPGLDAPGLDAGSDPCAMVSCGTDGRCVAGRCVPTCRASTDCAAAEHCTADGLCEARTACSSDDGCAANEFCDGTLCVPCDLDGDGWAGEASPSPRCSGSLGADCDDHVAATHPWALPDCMPATEETCITGGGLFAAENYEAGTAHLRDVVSEPGLTDFYAFPIPNTPPDALVLVVYRTLTDPEPRSLRVTLHPDGTHESSAAERVPGWALPSTPSHSQLAVMRQGSDLVLATAELTEGVIDLYGARYDGAAWQPLLGAEFRRSITAVEGDNPVSVDHLAVSTDASGAREAAVIAAYTRGVHFLLLGLDTTHQEDVTPTFDPAAIGLALSGGRGALFVHRAEPSQVHVWNGSVGPAAAFNPLDQMSRALPAFASGIETSQPLAAVITPAGGAMVYTTALRCIPDGACSQAQHGLDLFESDPGLSPRLSATFLAGSAVLVAGVKPSGDLALSALDMREGGPPTPHSVTFAVPGADAWSSTQLGAFVQGLGPSYGAVLAAVAAQRADAGDLFVLRVCTNFGAT